MNYQKHYDLLIARAQSRPRPDCYTEQHHVLPKCLGGGNEKTNIVILTAEEHFFAHELLIKIHPKHTQLSFAMYMLCGKKNHKRKMYAWLRVSCAKALSIREKGKVKTLETRDKLSAAMKGRPSNTKGMKLTEEHRAKMSAALKGRKVSDATRTKIAKSNTGKTRSAETRAKQSAAKKGKPSNMLGKTHSAEARAKMSDALKGTIVSDETRAKRSVALKGRIFTEEHRAKLSASQKGKPRPELRGKKRSPETIAKMCATQQRLARERAAKQQQPLA